MCLRIFHKLLLALPIIVGATNFVVADERHSENGSSAWVLTLGGGLEYGPSYEGAKKHAFGFVPVFDVQRLGDDPSYSAPDDNFDYSIFQLGGLELGPVVGIRGTRSPFDDPNLGGTHKIDWSIDAGAFAQYWPIENKLRFRVEGRQGIRRTDGFVADFGADWFQPLGKRWLFSVGPRLSLANKSYMQNNFSISPADTDNGSLLPAYEARGGLKSTGFVVSATYQINNVTTAQIYDKYDRLLGDATSSPIVKNGGSANQNSIGIVLSRSFQLSF